nr:hypothetical protein [Bordetella bronchiseptica]
MLVILTWVAFSLYIHHSLVTVGGTAAQIAELLVYITVVATMAAALTAWMIVCRFHGWIRARDNEEVGVGLDPEYALPPRWPLPEGANRLLVDHDEAGAIVQVSAWYVPAAIEPVVAAAMASAVMPEAAPLSEPAPVAAALARRSGRTGRLERAAHAAATRRTHRAHAARRPRLDPVSAQASAG